jgi:hypothetical protein
VGRTPSGRPEADRPWLVWAAAFAHGGAAFVVTTVCWGILVFVGGGRGLAMTVLVCTVAAGAMGVRLWRTGDFLRRAAAWGVFAAWLNLGLLLVWVLAVSD